jgi:hypothetical protein
MNSIRKYVYVTLLALSALNLSPGLVSAQEPARGKFTLPHDVHWENAIVPAGDYQFSIESDSIDVLRLDKISGNRAGFIFLVRDEQPSKASDISRITLETRPTGSYVSAMQLPDFGITLNFAMPASTTEKQMARAVTTHSLSGQ